MSQELKLPWRHTSVGIIDDKVEWRRTVRSMVLSFGVTEVVEASDGSDFLKKMNKQDCDLSLLLVDDDMHPMDGFVFMYNLRAKAAEPLRRVVSILMAGQYNAEIGKHALDVGYNNVLSKPFSARELENFAQKTLMCPVQWKEDGGILRPVAIA
ncbi:response regulator [Telmatospirillum sp.]|uniref:response regulator n=1 Tax=Telmatospirillum sp. TaxID=2079197 RepID=UPI00283FF0F7|nr:response regulator [Telmatospirillum sp.]MDR3439672.1 response regulator [Telmatospirillum sp.]